MNALIIKLFYLFCNLSNKSLFFLYLIQSLLKSRFLIISYHQHCIFSSAQCFHFSATFTTCKSKFINLRKFYITFMPNTSASCYLFIMIDFERIYLTVFKFYFCIWHLLTLNKLTWYGRIQNRLQGRCQKIIPE